MAKDLYVSASVGNDTVSYANNDINNPWQTVEHALVTAGVGDTVYYRTGTYTISSIFNTNGTSAVHGTATQRITHRGYPGEVATFKTTGGNKLNIDKDYWTFSHLYGECEIFLFHVGSVSGGGNYTNFDNNEFTITTDTYALSGSNVGAIQLQTGSSYYCEITNNKFTGDPAFSNENVAGMYIWRSQGTVVTNNEFYNLPSGCFFKHTNAALDGGEFAYNYFEDCGAHGWGYAGQYCDVHDNIFNRSQVVMGGDGGPGDDGSNRGSDYNIFNHNTVVGTNAFCKLLSDTLADGYGATYCTLKNNIFANEVWIHRYNDVPHNTTMDYNLYDTTIAVVGYLNQNYTLDQWKVEYLQDVNSIDGSPTFNGGATPTTVAGFALTPESDGYQAGDDGKDLGANVSLVGINARAVTPPTGNLLIDEEFTSTPLVAPWYDEGIAFTLDTDRFEYPWSIGDGPVNLGAARRLFASSTEIDISFDFQSTAAFPYGLHLFYFKLATAGIYEAPSTGATIYLEPQADGSFYVDLRRSDDTWHSWQPTTTINTLDGASHTVRMILTLNDFGSSNGTLKIYIDDIQTHDISDASIIVSSEHELGQLLLGPYLNNAPVSQTSNFSIYVDNLSVYGDGIDAIYEGKSSGTDIGCRVGENIGEMV